MSTLTTAFMTGLAAAAKGIGLILPFAIIVGAAYCVRWAIEAHRDRRARAIVNLQNLWWKTQEERDRATSELAAITRTLDGAGAAKTERGLDGKDVPMAIARRVRVALEAKR